jgi:hypothetical protein
MRALPAWCANRAGRDLIAAIIVEQPTYRIIPASLLACSVPTRRYDGTNAARLRKMHENALNAACEAMDDADGTPAYKAAHADFAAIARVDADALIERVLGEAAVERSAAA